MAFEYQKKNIYFPIINLNSIITINDRHELKDILIINKKKKKKETPRKKVHVRNEMNYGTAVILCRSHISNDYLDYLFINLRNSNSNNNNNNNNKK